jgi:hypothetical protein
LSLVDVNSLDMAATRSMSVTPLGILDRARFTKGDMAFGVEDDVLEGDGVVDVVVLGVG